MPLSVTEAEEFLKKHDRHYVEPAEYICAIGVGEVIADLDGENQGVMNRLDLAGAAILGRNAAGEGCLAHIYVDGVSQGYSLLYGACWRALKALGYRTAVL